MAAVVVLAFAARLLRLDFWEGSDEQALVAMLLEYGLVPIFAAMLGAALIHGEHAPWSWGLARPISRGRWAATSIAMDALTLVLAVTAIRTIVGEVPGAVQNDILQAVGLRFMPELGGGIGPLLVLASYVGAGVGAARGHSTLRALPAALVYVLALVFATGLLFWIDRGIAGLFVVDAWETPANAGLIELEYADHDTTEMVLRLGGLAVVVVGALAHVLARAITRLPARMMRREVVTVFTLWAVAVFATCLALRSRLWAIDDAPILAQRGTATLVVDDWAVLAERDCDECFARMGSCFKEVVPGSYRLCVGARETWSPDLDFTSANIFDRHERQFERCVDIEVQSGRNVPLLDFERAPLSPIPRAREAAQERDHPLAGLLVMRDLAELAHRKLVRDADKNGGSGAMTRQICR